jgi:hypothetical protein
VRRPAQQAAARPAAAAARHVAHLAPARDRAVERQPHRLPGDGVPGSPADAPAGGGSQPAPPRPAPAAPQAPPRPAPGEPAAPPEPLPLAPGSISYTDRNWQPTARDSCPKELHDSYAVIGPDGKRYPSWHPPTAVDPATGRPCTFGHEHGRDPRGAELFGRVADHLAAAGRRAHAGVPFGLATEALEAFADANPGTPRRREDHVGYKVDWENDVALVARDGSRTGVTCDYLVLVHQGSHSADATANNVHDMLYAVRCDDGTELVSSIVSRFGAAGEYTRSCDPAVRVATTPAPFPGGPGERSIPDRTCVESSFLVPPGRTTSSWALYEKWSSQNTLRSADPDRPPLASFDTAFGVFNPSRYARPSDPARIGRSIDLCWEREANGDRANGVECDEATEDGTIASPYAWDDPRSPFDGTYRDFYVRGAQLTNDGGPRRWYTDPYGGNASRTPFPGAICQLVGDSGPGTPDAQEQVFGRNRTNEAEGVHAPN